MSLENLSIILIDELDDRILSHLTSKLGKVLKLRIRINSWDSISALSRSEFKEGSKYRSTELLNHFSENLQDETGKFLFLTDSDLYSPVFSKFFGEALLNGKIGIISLFHLKEISRSNRINMHILISRVEKEVIHEVGHLMGLIHCPDINCAMHLSGTVYDIDTKSSFFCNLCLDVLKNTT